MKITKANAHKVVTVLLFGFSSGLPLALTGSSLQAWYTVAGVGLVGIGVLSLLGQPYVYKFLWAPFLDRYIPPFLGRRRGWIIVTQLGLTLTIAWMSFQNPAVNPVFLGVLAFLVALLSATQDIAIDAFRTESAKPEERGWVASCFVGGYRFAMLVSGGLAFVMADLWGWRDTYLAMSLLMALFLIVTWFANEPALPVDRPTSLKQAILQPCLELWRREGVLLILGLVVLYKFTDAFALSMTTTFLLRGLHFSLIDLGVLYKVVGFTATLVGVFWGGLALKRLGMFRALLFYGVLQAASNLLFVVLALIGKSYTFLIITIFIENLCGGLATAAFFAFLMSLCDQRYTATQYAVLSALAAVGRVFLGGIAGYIALKWGWINFYLCATLAALPAIVMVIVLREKINSISGS